MKDLNGLILAGGKSSRMGVEKSSLTYHGMPQREYLADVLRKFCDQVFLSVKQKGDSDTLHVVDKFELDSPLNGILSALMLQPNNAWLAVAVDMPHVDVNVIEVLVKNRNRNKVATCFFNPDEKLPEPLLTIWEPRARPLLEQFYLTGGVSPRNFLRDNDVQLITPADPKILVNINTPEEFKKFNGS